MTDVFSKQIAIEIEDGRKLAKVPLGKIGEHGWASLWACLQSRPSCERYVRFVPCVDGSELARDIFTFAELVGAAMCSAC